MIQPLELLCSALSLSRWEYLQLNRPRSLSLKNWVTLQLVGGTEDCKCGELFFYGSLFCERKVMHGKFKWQRSSLMHTCTKRQSLTIYSSIKKEKKRDREKKKRLLKLLSTLCGDKGVNFLENFLTKKMFWYCLCTVSLRDSHAKK